MIHLYCRKCCKAWHTARTDFPQYCNDCNEELKEVSLLVGQLVLIKKGFLRGKMGEIIKVSDLECLVKFPDMEIEYWFKYNEIEEV